MISEKQAKAMLAVMSVICFMVLTSELYRAYQKYIPPYREGQCFELSDAKVGSVKFHVVNNDMQNSTTQAVAEVNNPFGMEGVKLNIPVQATFQEIRGSNTKQVSCQ